MEPTKSNIQQITNAINELTATIDSSCGGLIDDLQDIRIAIDYLTNVIKERKNI